MRVCSIEGCGDKHKCKGYCSKHYTRLLTTGTTDLIPRSKVPMAERFWSKVEKTDTCWNWTGGKDALGYGRFTNRTEPGRTGIAHRLSYEMAHGEIPEGMVIDHMCHNTSCVRPEHLRACTQKQNLENQSGAYSNSKSGIRGVSWHSATKAWVGFVSHNRKMHHVGRFTDIQQAEAAVIAKRLELHTHNDQDRQQRKAA